jgi:hypothetical protein
MSGVDPVDRETKLMILADTNMPKATPQLRIDLAGLEDFDVLYHVIGAVFGGLLDSGGSIGERDMAVSSVYATSLIQQLGFKRDGEEGLL